MRRGQRRHMVVAVGLILAACSGGGSGRSNGTTSPAATLAPSAPAATTPPVTSPPPSVASTPSATVAATTTTTVPATVAPTSAPPTTVRQLYRCDTSTTDAQGLCVGITAPLPPDADQILATYLAFAKKDLEVSTNPDAPDWDGYLAMVLPEKRAEARKDLQDRFDKGQILNATSGVSYSPRLSRLRYKDGYIQLDDCRVDGTYWMDRASGQPAAGEDPTPRRRVFEADLERKDGLWLISGYGYRKSSC